MNTIDQAALISSKMDERLGDLPDDQPYFMTAGDARAYKETLDELRRAVELFGSLKLESVKVCLVATEALQNPDQSVVRPITAIDAIQYAEVRDVFDRLHKDLNDPEDNGGG